MQSLYCYRFMNALTQERSRLNVELKAAIKPLLQGMVLRVTHVHTQGRNPTNVRMKSVARHSKHREIYKNTYAHTQVS